MIRLIDGFRALLPGPMPLTPRERWRTAVGAGVGLLVTALISHLVTGGASDAALVAPLGASALLLFALATSPMAQPWAVILGNFVSALVGVACARLVDNPVLAGPVAVGLAIGAMYALRCLHPPGGAMALYAVLGHHAEFSFALDPVALDSLLLVLAAAAYHAATGRRYPHGPSPARSSPVGAVDASRRFTAADIDAALAQFNQVVDVSRSDLETLLQQAEAVAYKRRLGEIRCADVMSQNVVSVQYGDSLETAWSLMREHQIKALPVVDRVRRVVGILTLSDFLRHANPELHDGLGQRLRQLVRPSGRSSSDKPEAVGQIMTRLVRVTSADRHVVDLVPLFSQHGHHHIPVVDGEKRLVGIITQSDLVRALFNGAGP